MFAIYVDKVLGVEPIMCLCFEAQKLERQRYIYTVFLFGSLGSNLKKK